MIEKVTYNSPTNLLNKYTQQKSDNTNTKVSETPNDEVVIKKNNDKKKGSKILKTILGFGSSTVIGGFIGRVLAEKETPKIKNKLTENLENIYEELCNFKDSSAVTEQGKRNYKKLTNVLYGINKYNGSDYKCILFEGKDKKLADKIIDWIGNVCNKEYKVINFDIDDIGDILNEGEELKEIRLFRVENLDKRIKNDAKDSAIASGKRIMSACGQGDTNAILIFHAKDFNELDDIARAPHRISKHFKVDEMKDFDSYADLYKKFQETENKLSNISKTTKTKFIAIGIAAGLAVATAIFTILKIKNKGKKNENISNSNK